MDFTQSDRDRIIRHDVKLGEVCKSLGKIDKKLDKLSDDIVVSNKTFVTRKLFLSINGIIIGLLIILFGYTSNIDKQVTKNTVNIEHIEELIK
ncbi:MAG: hypothetical protein KAJ19_18050 [Gammaproteobacteria bacterium]|nr:hypothetical protein [Gammaproteobacteria bacterium]